MSPKNAAENSMSSVLDSHIFESLDQVAKDEIKKTAETDNNNNNRNNNNNNNHNNHSNLEVIGSTPFSNKILNLATNTSTYNSNELMFTPFFNKSNTSMNRLSHLTSARKSTTKGGTPANDIFFNFNSPSMSKLKRDLDDFKTISSANNTKAPLLSDFILSTPQKAGPGAMFGDSSLLGQSSILRSWKKKSSKVTYDNNNGKEGEPSTDFYNEFNVDDLNGFSPFLRNLEASSKKRKVSTIDSPTRTPSGQKKRSIVDDDYINKVLMDYRTPKALRKRIYAYNINDLNSNIEEEMKFLNNIGPRSSLSTSLSRKELDEKEEKSEETPTTADETCEEIEEVPVIKQSKTIAKVSKKDSKKNINETNNNQKSQITFRPHNAQPLPSQPIFGFPLLMDFNQGSNFAGHPMPGFQSYPFAIPPPGFPNQQYIPSVPGPFMIDPLVLPQNGFPYLPPSFIHHQQQQPQHGPIANSSVTEGDTDDSVKTPSKQNTLVDSPSTILATSVKRNLTNSLIQQDYLNSPTPDITKNDKISRFSQNSNNNSMGEIPSMGTFSKTTIKPVVFSNKKPQKNIKKSSKKPGGTQTNFQFVFTDVKSYESYQYPSKPYQKKKSNPIKRSNTVGFFNQTAMDHNKENIDPNNNNFSALPKSRSFNKALSVKNQNFNTVNSNKPTFIKQNPNTNQKRTIVKTSSVPNYKLN